MTNVVQRPLVFDTSGSSPLISQLQSDDFIINQLLGAFRTETYLGSTNGRVDSTWYNAVVSILNTSTPSGVQFNMVPASGSIPVGTIVVLSNKSAVYAVTARGLTPPYRIAPLTGTSGLPSSTTIPPTCHAALRYTGSVWQVIWQSSSPRGARLAGNVRWSTAGGDQNITWYSAALQAGDTKGLAANNNVSSSTVAVTLDTGSYAADTWYHLHAFMINSGTGSYAPYASLSETAPTLPSTYFDFVRIGSVRTDGSGNFLPVEHLGRDVFYRLRNGLTAYPTLFSGNQGSGATPASVSVSSLVPPTATHIKIAAHAQFGALAPTAGQYMYLCQESAAYTVGSVTPPPFYLAAPVVGPFGAVWEYQFPADAQNLYAWSNLANGGATVLGWVDGQM